MKRSIQKDEAPSTNAKQSLSEDAQKQKDSEMGEFEDPYYDEADSGDEAALATAGSSAEANEDAEMIEGDDVAGSSTEPQQKQVFIPGVDKLEQGEKMDYDPSAYLMYHKLRFGWPCLSFDFVRDSLGTNRTKFPLSCFMVAGTQAGDAGKNSLEVVKLSDLCKTREADGEDSDDEDSDMDDDPVMTRKSLQHQGAVNRVRCMPQQPSIVATWADTGVVYLWDVAQQLGALGYEGAKALPGLVPEKPFFVFKGHTDEGYAMDWSPVASGSLATGDCHSDIFVWSLAPEGACQVNQKPFRSHKASVEDIQWSPTEGSVFASCSVDKTVMIWDTRNAAQSSMLTIDAHDTDVNVISWNPTVPYLMASGADDGCFKTWDLRKPGSSVANQRFHKAPVAGIEWHPTDESVVAVSCADHSVSVWDLALEEDAEHAAATPGLSNEVFGSDMQKLEIPPTLLFTHHGLQDPKEVHFHPQIPGLIGCTGADGFDAFICEPLDPKAPQQQRAQMAEK